MKMKVIGYFIILSGMPSILIGNDRPAIQPEATEVVSVEKKETAKIIDFARELEKKFGAKHTPAQEKELLASLLKEYSQVVVDFYATWCGPCKRLSPVLHDLVTELQVVAIKVDVDSCRIIADEYDVTAMPTIVLLHNGKKVHETHGFSNKQSLKNLIQTHFKS